MPTEDRAAAPGLATIYYRCGSQRGKPAATVPSTVSESDFADLTADFVAAQIKAFRRAKASRQKNSARNLKKYFDASEIALIEARVNDAADDELARQLL